MCEIGSESPVYGGGGGGGGSNRRGLFLNLLAKSLFTKKWNFHDTSPNTLSSYAPVHKLTQFT